MQTLPTVSVVIATRNRPEMLKAAVTAVMEQTYEGAVRCIIVFDRTEPDHSLAHDDGTRSVDVITNTQSGGLAGARNSGIQAATGEFIAFCDDDDLWHPTKLARQVETIGSALTSVTGIVVDYGDRQAVRIPRQDAMTLHNVVRTRRMEAHPSTVMMNRAGLLEHVGLVDEDIPGSYGEDFDFMIRALQAGPIAVVEEPLVTVRWGQSMFSRDWATIVNAIDYIIDKHDVVRADKKALARLHGRRAFATAAMGDSVDSLRGCWRTVTLSPSEKRAYVTLPVALRLVKAERLLDLAHRRGRGI